MTRERVREAMRTWRARYGARRPRTTGRARTHVGAAAKRSNDYRPENGPRRPLSSICTGAGRRPSPTPSAAPKRSGVNAVDIRTRACAWPPVNGSTEGRRDASAIRLSGRRDAASPRSSVSSRRLYGAHNSGSPAVTATRSARLSQPWRSHREHRAPPDARPVAKRARELPDRPRSQRSRAASSPTVASRLEQKSGLDASDAAALVLAI